VYLLAGDLDAADCSIVAGLQYHEVPVFTRYFGCVSVRTNAFIFSFCRVTGYVIIPVFAKEVVHKGANGYGYLLSAMGIGSLIGAILVSIRSKKGPRGKLLFVSAILECVFYIILGFVQDYFLSIVALVILGFFSVIFMTIANSTVQLNSSDEYRGRVMSIYTRAFAGTTPIGNFFAGSVTEKLGANAGFFACGFVTIICITLILMWIWRNLKSN
jgi:predicted MFS family arabinose efflux permease